MTDFPQGEGWWQASDGKWYPPEQHPGFQPPTIPTPPVASAKGPNRGPLIALAAVVAIALIVGAIVLFSGGDDDEETASTDDTTEQSDESDTDESDETDDDTDIGSFTDFSDDTDATDETDATGGPDVTPIPATGPIVDAAGVGVTITLPEGYVGAPTENGTDGVGAALFPNDPDLAAAVQGGADLLPGAVVIFGLDENAMRRGDAFTPNINVLPDDTVPSGLDIEEVGRLEANGIEQFGGTVESRDLVNLRGTDAVRIMYSLDSMDAAFVAYVLISNEQTWVLTYTFASLAQDSVALAEGSAETFRYIGG